MKHSPVSTTSQAAKPRPLAAPRHARCRLAVLAALRDTAPLPDDDTFRAQLAPLVDAAPGVRQALENLRRARESLREARSAPPRPYPSLRQLEQLVEERENEARRARASVLHFRAADRVPESVPEGTTWPWRNGGAPWVWRADLLLALPDWSHTAIHGALERLEAEGLVEGNAGHRAKKAGAVRFTDRGLKLDELVATLKAHPGIVDGPVGEALNDDAEGGAP